MKTFPLVSIVIPCYNAEKWISECLESCINQTYDHIEIIVVDDGSNDQSLRIIESFKDVRIKTVRQENKGANAARNYGFNLSVGDWIVFLDADDFLHCQTVEKNLEAALNNPGSLVACRIQMFLDGSAEKTKALKLNQLSDFSATAYSPSCFLRETRIEKKWLQVQTAGWMFPRNLIEKCGGFDLTLKIYQETELCMRVFPKVEKIILLGFNGVFYRKFGISGENIFNLSRPEKLKELERSLIKFEIDILGLWSSRESRQVLIYEYLRFATRQGFKSPSFFCFCILRVLRIRKIAIVYDLIYFLIDFVCRKIKYRNQWKKFLPK